MNRFALLTLLRSLARHKLYTALNIGGLALGIAVFIVLTLYVRFETSFERWVPDHDQIYLVQTEWNLPGSPFNGAYPNTMGGLLEQLRQDFPSLEGTRINGGAGGGAVIQGNAAATEDVAQVDSNFFRLFNLPMVKGDGRNALAAPNNALISETASRKYFGTSDPLGRTLTISIDAPATYRIAGVFKDISKSSDLHFSILVPLPKTAPSSNWYHWGSTSLYTYVRFDTLRDAKAFEQKLLSFVDRRGRNDIGENASRTIKLTLLPLTAAHLQPTGQESASRQLTVVSLGIVGLLTLLIAIINYVNLATARAGLRAREVAMRKVLGASRNILIRQFIGEAILVVAVAALFGLILAELGLPLINAAGGLSLAIPYALTVPALAILSLLVGLAAGFYPAILLSNYPAAAVLASARSPGGGRVGTRTREVLVVFQFGLAIAFMIGTVVLVAQTHHLRKTDLGFNRDGLFVVTSLADSNISQAQAQTLLEAFRAMPEVRQVGVANSAAGGSGENNADNVPLPGVSGEGPSLRSILVSPGFFEAYKPRLVAGRLFDEVHGADDATGWSATNRPRNIVINQKAVSVLGFASPQDAVGKTVGGEHPRTIIGVIDQMRFFSPRLPDDATYFVYQREIQGTRVATLRFAGDPREFKEKLRGVWQRLAPQVPFNGDTADNRLAKLYEADEQATRLFSIGAALAVLIGCVGLWGLASFNTTRRIKEIGIRKTLGASTGDIGKLLIGQFLRPVLLANLIAWPLAWIAMRTWLAGFDDRIALSPIYFIAASIIALAIAILTVFGQSLRASRSAPAWALRHE